MIALRGKLDAGNPPVRSDERVLLYKSKSITAVVVILFTLVHGIASAETFTLKQVPSSLANWKSSGYYVEGTAPTGASTDEIVIPLGMTVTVSYPTDSAVIAFLNGIDNVKPQHTQESDGPIAKFVVDVDEGATLDWTSRFYSHVSERNVHGSHSYVQKTGKGALRLCHTDAYAYQSRFVVSEGELWLPPLPDGTTSKQYKYYGAVFVEADGVVRTDRCNGSNAIWDIDGLYNDGVVKTESDTSTTIYLGSDSYLPPTQVMKCDGQYNGKLSIYVRNAHLELMGTNSTVNYMAICGYASYGSQQIPEVRAINLGMKADATSALGKADPAIHIEGDIGGRFIYCGKGETSNKDMRLISTTHGEINGGEHGGLRLTGSFTRYASSTTWNPTVVFGGDHTNACEFAGSNADFKFTSDSSSQYYGRTYVRYIKKIGAGEWYFPFNINYTSGGTVAVADGTLSYDYMDVKGRLSSLGLSTNCYAETTRQPYPTDNPTNHADYAFLLGGNSDEETGFFESRSSTVQQCTDRPFGLKGRGGFRANCGEVRYANVFGVTSGGATLVLDGTNAYENIVCDVSDGTAGGTVSIEKNGSGIWVLGGDQTFTGSLTVNGGTLVVRRPAQTYRRYRLLIKEIVNNNAALIERRGTPSGDVKTVSFAEVGLWDEDNRRVNMNLAYNTDYRALQPGQCAWGWSLNMSGATAAQNTTLLFDGNRYTYVSGTKVWGAVNNSFSAYGSGVTNPGARQSDPLTWIPLDMYLAEGEKPVHHFDVYAGDTANLLGQVPAVVQLQASVDGIHWDEVSDNVTYDHSNTRYAWLSTGASASLINNEDGHLNSPDTATFNRAEGWRTTKTVPTKVFSMLEDVGPVTVANGATLKYEGSADGAPELSKIKLATGATGSIDGFAFASQGTFEIDAMPGPSVSIAVTLPDSTGLSNVGSWQVKVGGQDKLGYRVVASENGFTVTKKGFCVILQ